jgi:hypothetical protein
MGWLRAFVAESIGNSPFAAAGIQLFLISAIELRSAASLRKDWVS